MEIAQLLGVDYQTVRKWRSRNVLPEPDAIISGRPVWYRETVETWARETGRWPS